MFDLYDEFRKLVGALDEHQIDYALFAAALRWPSTIVVERLSLLIS